MIQRIQTLWLLLAAVAAFLTSTFSFFSGNIIAADQTKKFEELTARSNWLLLVLTIILGTGILIAIFLYKNRKLQLRTVLTAIILSIANIALYFYQSQKFVEGKPDLTALIALVIPVFLVLAARGINKDEKLVKSLDRLR
jgi:peptidoglycan/LPS O-acetylase OafA/YrhL